MDPPDRQPFPIPMRGNELHCQAEIRGELGKFPIPMGGNEWLCPGVSVPVEIPFPHPQPRSGAGISDLRCQFGMPPRPDHLCPPPEIGELLMQIT